VGEGMNYELSDREWGLVRASVMMTINICKQSNKSHELRHEYEELMKKMKV
jgi:hypothetical protein